MTTTPPGLVPRAPLRVAIIDDSVFVRMALQRILRRAGFEVAGVASDGEEGAALVREARPDVVTLDVNMPRMSGPEALARILADAWVPVVMCSTLTRRGADVTMDCLALGAVDFVAKPERREDWAHLERLLPPKLRVAATARQPVAQRGEDSRPSAGEQAQQEPQAPRPPGQPPSGAASLPAWQPPPAPRFGPDAAARGVLLIAASTGGPGAIATVVRGLPPDLPWPVLVTQHMPPGFTRSFAERLDRGGGLRCKEAEGGEEALPGWLYVAPGGWHLRVEEGGRLSLDDSAPRWGVRPAADVMFESAVEPYGAAAVAAVLTGMGRDGAAGAAAIRRAGGTVVAESQDTAVIYGMPRAVAESGAADRVVDLPEVAGALVEAVAARLRKVA